MNEPSNHMRISHIVAAGTNDAIGKNNQLLWHLPQDLKFFKNTTWAMPVIMGRKTFEAVDSKPLPGRFNIVVTRRQDLKSETENLWFATSIDEALAIAKNTGCKEIFIAGGAEIYAQTLPITHRIYLTRVHAHFEADAFFPALAPDEWQLVNQVDFSVDAKHAYSFSVQTWDRV